MLLLAETGAKSAEHIQMPLHVAQASPHEEGLKGARSQQERARGKPPTSMTLDVTGRPLHRALVAQAALETAPWTAEGQGPRLLVLRTVASMSAPGRA